MKITQEARMSRQDYILLAILVAVYSWIALFNLGDRTAPQTYYQPSRAGESFEISLAHETYINKISYYYGIGDVGQKPGITLEYLTPENEWKRVGGADVTLKSVFKWEMQEVDGFTTQKIRACSDSAEFSLYELAFWDEHGSLAPIAAVHGDGEANFSAVADEQEFVPQSPSFQNSTYFDEIYHPRSAFEMLHLLPYYEYTHPPLGKAIMSLGIAIFGMTPFGWRIMGTLFGIFMLPLMYLFLKKLLYETKYAVMGTLLFAFDFMHFSLTRMGTIDSYPVFFILAMYYFMYLFGRRALYYVQEYGAAFAQDRRRKRSLLFPLALSGIAWGCAAASKWIGVYAGFGLLIIFIAIMTAVRQALRTRNKGKVFRPFAGKICAWCVIFFVIVPAGIYTASYIQISMIPGYGNAVQEMWRNQFDMLSYHGNLQATHSYSSRWYQWPIVYRPLWAYKAPASAVAEGNIGCISIMGNPILYGAGIAAFAAVIVLAIKRKSKSLSFLLIALLAQYLPWALIQRTTFIYHFFASTPFLIIMIVCCMRELEHRHRTMCAVNIGFCVLCLGLFVMFYPVLSGMEVSREYVDTFLQWSKNWVFYN